MTARRTTDPDALVDVQRAARLVGRHPETVRRWVWSGRLAGRREGRRLLVSRSDVEALAGLDPTSRSLRDWAVEARAVRGGMPPGAAGRSAADLVIEDRQRRTEG